jgi:hypothetical protein
MEVLLLLAAGIAAHEYLKEPEVVIPPAEVRMQTEMVLPTGEKQLLASIDWSKAGNFRQTSSTNNIEWVIISE